MGGSTWCCLVGMMRNVSLLLYNERAFVSPEDGKKIALLIVLLSVLWVMCSSHVFSSSSVGGDVKALNDDVNDDGLLPIAKEELEEVLREEENG